MLAEMPDLFGFEAPRIGGLAYVGDFIGVETERSLLAHVDAGAWNTTLQRRMQHYGRRYDAPAEASAGDGSVAAFAAALPEWLRPLSERLLGEGCCEVLPDRVSVNEYLPGQGIAPHIDAGLELIRDIMILSLGSACVMEFTHEKTGRRLPRLLERRSLTVISGEARRDWLHGIPKRRTDVVHGARLVRGRRVSIMFRALHPAAIRSEAGPGGRSD